MHYQPARSQRQPSINLAHLRNQKTRIGPVDGHSVLGLKLNDKSHRGTRPLQSTVLCREAPEGNCSTNSLE